MLLTWFVYCFKQLCFRHWTDSWAYIFVADGTLNFIEEMLHGFAFSFWLITNYVLGMEMV